VKQVCPGVAHVAGVGIVNGIASLGHEAPIRLTQEEFETKKAELLARL
jgi:hypothetical protein